MVSNRWVSALMSVSGIKLKASVWCVNYTFYVTAYIHGNFMLQILVICSRGACTLPVVVFHLPVSEGVAG